MEQSAVATNTWPWAVSLAPRRFEVAGDLAAAAELGIGANVGLVAYHTCQLLSGLPLTIHDKATWTAGPGSVELTVETAALKLSQTFARDEDGQLVVDFGLLMIASSLQGRGNSKLMLRRAIPVYDKIGVSHIIAYANYDIGGYAWAKLGAAALVPDLVRQEMAAKLLELEKAHGVPGMFEPAQKILSSVDDDTLMRELALAKRVDGQEIGKVLLMNYGWEAVWDLSDQHQRALLIEALS